MKIVTAEQMRRIEQIAIEDMGIPSILLMENAAIRLAGHCLKALDGIENPRVIIVCGPGNNGGDGMALARLLHNKGVETKVIFAGDMSTVKGDPAAYLGIIRKLGITIETIPLTGNHPDISTAIKACDLTVDALLGTGLARNVEGNYKYLVDTINNYAKHIISADIPSGVHSDTGQIMGCAVKANQTVTFGYPKIGLYAHPGAAYAGKIHIEDISLPPALINKVEANAEILTDSEAGHLLPVRSQRSNKGDFGRILVFAGSNEMPGAAALVCSAPYMVGGGLVCACVLPHVADIVHKWQREVITRIVPEMNGMYCKKSIEAAAQEIDRAGVIVLGPGIGRSPGVTEFVQELIAMAKVPLVLDADALFAVSEDINILKTLKAPCVITPHPGEMSRLTGQTVSGILDNIIGTAAGFSREFNVVTLLKDAHTIVANTDGKIYINTTGNDALSKAGTGDVLTGMIAGFIAQGSCAYNASILGAYIHGKSGEAAAINKSNYGVTAADLLNNIPAVINHIARSRLSRLTKSAGSLSFIPSTSNA
jgi:NAD(P)H-hydrate epimerase